MDEMEDELAMVHRLRQLTAGRPAGARRGFTLVELMIAMALVGLLTAVIYGLFVQTSDSLSDVEHHSAALDQARFGVQQVRTGLWAAGSQATPNAEADPWVLSGDRGADEQPQVYGIIQDDEMTDESLDDVGFGGPTDNNDEAAFDSFVVVGSFDSPGNLFVSFTDNTGPDNPEFVIEGTERGLYRLLGYDPFDTEVINSVEAPGDIVDRSTQRLLRVRDSEGFSQIQPISSASVESVDGDNDVSAGGQGVDGEELQVALEELYFRTGDQPAGFDQSTEQDVSFDAAMIDAYWYHVTPAHDNDRNLQLIRQRLDATQLLGAVGGGQDLDRDTLEGFRVDPPMVLAERVADFRVWFDCVTGSENVISGRDWEEAWNVDRAGNERDCVEERNPEDAQVAHVRLSTRTAGENANRPHYDLEGVPAGFESDQGQMRTFELFSEAEGSAGVVTTQGSVELTNFSMSRSDDGV